MVKLLVVLRIVMRMNGMFGRRESHGRSETGSRRRGSGRKTEAVGFRWLLSQRLSGGVNSTVEEGSDLSRGRRRGRVRVRHVLGVRAQEEATALLERQLGMLRLEGGGRLDETMILGIRRRRGGRWMRKISSER